MPTTDELAARLSNAEVRIAVLEHASHQVRPHREPTTDELAERLSNAEDRIALLERRMSQCARGRVVLVDWCEEISVVIEALSPGVLSRTHNSAREDLRAQAQREFLP
jgi:hypothetical protein